MIEDRSGIAGGGDIIIEAAAGEAAVFEAGEAEAEELVRVAAEDLHTSRRSLTCCSSSLSRLEKRMVKIGVNSDIDAC